MSPSILPMNAFSLSGLTSMMASFGCQTSSMRWLGPRRADDRQGGRSTRDRSPLSVLHSVMSSGREGGSTSQHKSRHQLDMRGVAELVDRRHALDLVAAVDQDFGVAGKRRDIARH